VVEDGQSGWLVPPEDVGALAQALTELLADPQEAIRRGRVGRRRVEDLATPMDAGRRWLGLVGGEAAREEG
jgi:glycosyltransferase involved in cell wall biosynthesis